MSEVIRPGAGILFMKVGVHARENLEDIIARKMKEIEDTGFSMWGYGGNTCHPTTMVQPFAAEWEQRQSPILLVMNEMNSSHWAEQIAATRYSEDAITWKDIPPGIKVLGSRYALVIDNLQRRRLSLPLRETRVALGLSQGRSGSRYVQGRVDKACLEVIASSDADEEAPATNVQIDLVAKLKAPYAVFLK